MDTEKYYYGLNLDLETTKKDSSNIDCELPGKLPENPSLNTSLLNKGSVSLSSKYVKINNCPQEFILTKHNDAFTQFTDLTVQKHVLIDPDTNINRTSYLYNMSFGSGLLIGTKTNVYIGFQDHDMSFTNNLDSNIMSNDNTYLTSDTLGCEAIFIREPNDNTGAHIQFKLNKCTTTRTITFSYNKLPIFSIKQTYDNSGSSTTKSWTIYTYLIDARNFNNFNNNSGFALFDSNSPAAYDYATYGICIQQFVGMQYHSNYYVLMYIKDEGKIINYANGTIGELLSSGKLTHVDGHNYLEQTMYKNLFLDRVIAVNHFNELAVNNKDKFTTSNISLDTTIYLFIETQSQFYYNGYSFNFINTESNNHLGVYKLSSTT